MLVVVAVQSIVSKELALLQPGKQRFPPWDDAMLHYRYATYQARNLRVLFYKELQVRSTPTASSARNARGQGPAQGLGQGRAVAALVTNSSQFHKSVDILQFTQSSQIAGYEFDSYKKNLRSRLSATCLELIFGFQWVPWNSVFLCKR